MCGLDVDNITVLVLYPQNYSSVSYEGQCRRCGSANFTLLH